MLRLEVVEDRPLADRDDPDIDAGNSEQVELAGFGSGRISTDQGCGSKPEPGRGERGIRHSPTRPPAADVARIDVAGHVADVDDVDLVALGVS